MAALRQKQTKTTTTMASHKSTDIIVSSSFVTRGFVYLEESNPFSYHYI